MNDVPISKLIIIICSIFVLFFAGCSDSQTELVSAKGYVVFDYKDDSSLPSVKLAAFTEVSSDVRRVDSVRIKNRSTQIEWNCAEPLIFSDSKRQWAGYTECVSPENFKIPSGIYDFSYIDAQGNENSVPFTVSYNEKLLSSNSSSAKEKLSENVKEKIAVYSATGSLIYYGEKKDSWNEEKNIFSSNSGSGYYRTVYAELVDSVLLMMPPVYNSEKKQISADKK